VKTTKANLIIAEATTQIHRELLKASSYVYDNDVNYTMLENLSFVYNDEVYEWLSSDLSSWVYERPPLELYAKFLALTPFTNMLPELLFLDVLKVMNYFGNYSKTIELSQLRLKMSNINYKFQIVKHMCKALKSLGKHEDALHHYRLLILDSLDCKNAPKIAFLLILLGKLYDDYHLKKGLCRFFTKIAYEIMEEEISTISAGSPNGNLDKVWYQICADCYAKNSNYSVESSKHIKKKISVKNNVLKSCNFRNCVI